MTEHKWLVNPGQSRTIDLDGVRNVKISLIAGQVDVIAHDEPSTRVEVHGVTGKDLKVSLNGDRLEIDHPQLSWDNFISVFRSWSGRARAEVSVLVPRDAVLKLGTVSAGALVSGLSTGARISTVSGEISVDGVVGELEFNAVSGELGASNHRGPISVNTVSGDVTASGSAPRVSIDGVSANVFLDLEGVPDGIRNNTVSGDLTLRLDGDVAARYRVNTVSGALQIGDSVFKGTLGKKVEFQSGELEGRWIEVEANSVSGKVSVVRRVAAAEHPASRGAGA